MATGASVCIKWVGFSLFLACSAVQTTTPVQTGALKITSFNENNEVVNATATGVEKLKVRFIHIPKTAGASFQQTVWKQGLVDIVNHDECCWNNDKFDYGEAKDVKVTFLREPRSHVLSQFIHCRHFRQNRNASRQEDMKTLHTWMTHVSSTSAPTYDKNLSRKIFNRPHCYDPRNMQVRYFLCSEARRCNAQISAGHEFWKGQDNIDLAMSHLNELWFFGLKEHFKTSMCLLEWQVRGNVSEHCRCGASESWEQHNVHGLPKHDVSEILPETLPLVDQITKNDKALYVAAERVFWERVKIMEKDVNEDVSCSGGLKKEL